MMRGSARSLLLFSAVCLLGCGGGKAEAPPSKDITLFASDGTAFHARTFAPVPRAASSPGLLMLPAGDGTLEEWDALARRAQSRGFTVLVAGTRAADGVEESAAYWERACAELAAAKAGLIEAGAGPARLAVMGAGAGACRALHLASRDHDIAAAVLLSPLLMHEGTDFEKVVAQMEDCPLLIIAGEQEAHSAAEARTLDEAAAGFCDLKLFPGAYKGIDVPAASASAARHIFQWLSEVMPPAR